jgi:hypothetical protein
MRLLNPAEISMLQRIGPLTWKSSGGDPAFIFDLSQSVIGFVGFFLIGSQGRLAPTLCVDEGLGFSELKTVSLKTFPIAFYHVPVRNWQKVQRIDVQIHRFLDHKRLNDCSAALPIQSTLSKHRSVRACWR